MYKGDKQENVLHIIYTYIPSEFSLFIYYFEYNKFKRGIILEISEKYILLNSFLFF